MTDLTDTLNRVLGEWLASQGGGFITGSYLVAEYVNVDGEPSWAYATAPDQRMTQTLGLIAWADGMARYEQRRYLDDIGDD